MRSQQQLNDKAEGSDMTQQEVAEQPPMDTLDGFSFDPFQFGGPEWRIRDFHKRHVRYYNGATRVLDLGCGRGYFLESLRSEDIQGVGVDSHGPSVEICRQKGLSVYDADVLTFLESTEGQTIAKECDAVYCAHVLEHLEPTEVFRLFRAIKQSCTPGVRCRFITNNPNDISVLGYVFWADLTHKRLYPPSLLAAMARSQGFTNIETDVFLGLKLTFRQHLQRCRDRILWGEHKWKPNLKLDCS